MNTPQPNPHVICIHNTIWRCFLFGMLLILGAQQGVAATSRISPILASDAVRGPQTAPSPAGQVIADFWNPGSKDAFSEKGFFFGLATAPAQVEDSLNDSWLQFARESKVPAWANTEQPEKRLNFWTDPEVELNLAAGTGAKVLRLGVDWERLAPHAPGSLECGFPCPAGVQDWAALRHYQEILKAVHRHGMKVMLTLFHHSLPRWAASRGGWLTPQTAQDFDVWVKDVVSGLGGEVDYWTTFNEPETFALLTYVAGIWPPGSANTLTAILNGHLQRAMDQMAYGHRLAYQRIKAKFPNSPVGIAALVAKHSGVGQSAVDQELANQAAHWAEANLMFGFTDRVISHLDYAGINYYAEEFIQVRGVTSEGNNIRFGTNLSWSPVQVPWRQYSESGRAIYPDGLYQALLAFKSRYPAIESKHIPVIITENGIADRTDLLRPSYLIEHLRAVHLARQEGVPVAGYIFWTISDNWEWADGYCPKFGLVAVDRKEGLARIKRSSYELFRQIASQGKIYEAQRQWATERISDALMRGESVYSCRDPHDPLHGLDVARPIPLNPAAPLEFQGTN